MLYVDDLKIFAWSKSGYVKMVNQVLEFSDASALELNFAKGKSEGCIVKKGNLMVEELELRVELP